MLTVDKFKKYAGIKIDDIEATKARGVLTLSRPTGNADIIAIPDGLIFQTDDKFYKSASPSNGREINESSRFIPYVIESIYPGPESNIGAGRHWQASMPVIFEINNEGPISGGAETIKGNVGNHFFDLTSNFSDERLQRLIDISSKIIQQMASNPDDSILDNPLVEEAVFLMAMYRLRNYDTMEHSDSFAMDGITGTARQTFKDFAFEPLCSQINLLLSQARVRKLDVLKVVAVRA